MAGSVYVSILLTLCKIQTSESENILGIREIKFRRVEFNDDFNGKGSNLWGLQTCVSCTQCAILCFTHPQCFGVLYHQQSRQCQGHGGTNGTVDRRLVKGTKIHSGMKYLEAGAFTTQLHYQQIKRKETPLNSQDGNQKLSPKSDEHKLIVHHGVSSSVHGKDSNKQTHKEDGTRKPLYIRDKEAKLEFHVYTDPLTWSKAEVFCADRGEQLIRLDNLLKLNRVRLYLHSRTRTRRARVFVGGYCCCQGKVFWGTERAEPASPEHFQAIPVEPFTEFGAWISGVDHASAHQLRLAKLSRTSHMFICERYEH